MNIIRLFLVIFVLLALSFVNFAVDAFASITMTDSPITRGNIRALHFVVKNVSNDESYEIIKKAKASNFNVLVIGVFSLLNGTTGKIERKNDLINIAKFARRNGMDVVPEIKLLSHQELFLKMSNPRLLFNTVTYDPRQKDVYLVVFSVLNDIIDIFHPKAIHIGHDEVAGHNERSAKRWLRSGERTLPADLFLSDVLRIHNYLKKRGVQTWMWGDMLMSAEEAPNMLSRHFHGNMPGYGKNLRKELPRDIVVCDWHYLDEQNSFPSVDLFQREGFRVIGATWTRSETIVNFSRYAAKLGAYGMMATTWYHVQRKHHDIVDRIIRESGEAFLNAVQ